MVAALASPPRTHYAKLARRSACAPSDDEAILVLLVRDEIRVEVRPMDSLEDAYAARLLRELLDS